mgnify:CR=1 FL=1
MLYDYAITVSCQTERQRLSSSMTLVPDVGLEGSVRCLIVRCFVRPMVCLLVLVKDAQEGLDVSTSWRDNRVASDMGNRGCTRWG